MLGPGPAGARKGKEGESFVLLFFPESLTSLTAPGRLTGSELEPLVWADSRVGPRDRAGATLKERRGASARGLPGLKPKYF